MIARLCNWHSELEASASTYATQPIESGISGAQVAGTIGCVVSAAVVTLLAFISTADISAMLIVFFSGIAGCFSIVIWAPNGKEIPLQFAAQLQKKVITANRRPSFTLVVRI